MAKQAKAVPEGCHTVTPSFTFKDSRKAIEFYKKDLTEDEVCKNTEAFFAQMAKK